MAFISTLDGYAALAAGHVDADTIERRHLLPEPASRRHRGNVKPRAQASSWRSWKSRTRAAASVERGALRHGQRSR
jgi:hypothetical protein